MLRTKITELGKLNLLDDGGLVCSVTLQVGPRQPPPLDSSARAASLYDGESSTLSDSSNHLRRRFGKAASAGAGHATFVPAPPFRHPVQIVAYIHVGQCAFEHGTTLVKRMS